MVHGGVNELNPMPVGERAWLNDQRQRAALLHSGQGTVQFGNVPNSFRLELHTQMPVHVARHSAISLTLTSVERWICQKACGSSA